MPQNHQKEVLYRVMMPYYVCGFLTIDNKIIECAPIMYWAKDKGVLFFSKWVKSKGGIVEKL